MFDIIATIRRDQERKNDTKSYSRRINYLINDLNINVFRINVGKWNEEEFETLIEDVKIIRDTANKYKKKARIILDLPFPGKKARVITYAKKVGFNIKKNKTVEIYSATEYELGKLHDSFVNKNNLIFGVSVPGIGKMVKIGDSILYADGEGEFSVKSIDGENKIIAVAKNNFKLDNAKSIHFKNSVYMSDLDETVVKLIDNIRPDELALSFVENVDCVKKIKKVLQQNGLSCNIMAKIESQKGVANIDDILDVVDSIMIGRGDLGLHIDIVDFPQVVFDLIEKTKSKQKYICVATGFMDTYVNQCIPSRSDIMDLFVTVNTKADGIVFTYKTVRENEIMKEIVSIINIWKYGGAK